MTGGLREADILRALSAAREKFDRERHDRFRDFGLPDDCAWPASRVFHDYSTLGPGWVPPLNVEQVIELTCDLDYKSYDGAPRIALALPLTVEASLVSALTRRRSVSEFREAPFTFAEVSTLLACGCGLTDGAEVPHRAAPSGGALYPIELYLAALDIRGLEPAIYHYLPVTGALERIGDVGGSEALATFLPPGLVAGQPRLLIALSARFTRTQAKYGERGYRFALLEAGHVMQNLLLLATAMGIGAVPVGGFWDDPFNHFIGLDGTSEAVIYSALLGRSA